MGTSSKRIFTKTMSQLNLQAQLKPHKPTQKKNCFKKISNSSKKIKHPTHKPDKKALDK